MGKCCVIGCGSNNDTNVNKMNFHKLPFKNKNKLKAWLKVINRKDFKFTPYSVICGLHFTKSDYINPIKGKRRKLKEDAVPSIFNCFTQSSKKETNIDYDKSVLETYSDTIDASFEKTKFSDVCQSNTSEEVEGKISIHIPLEKSLNTDTHESVSTDSHSDISRISPGSTIYRDNFCQTELTGEALQNTLDSLMSEKKRLKQQLAGRDNKITYMEYKSQSQQTDDSEDEELEDVLTADNKNSLPLILFENVLSNMNRAPEDIRYTENIKQFCMDIYSISPKAYEYMESRCALADTSTLKL